MKTVMEIVTEYLGSERLDSIILKTEEYRKADKEADAALEEMLGMEMEDEVRKALDKYLSAFGAVEAVYIRLAYQQGMKDLMEFAVSLIDNRQFHIGTSAERTTDVEKAEEGSTEK